MNDSRLNVCGNCRFNKHDGKDFYCANEMSERITEYVRYGDSCEAWEGKEQ